MLCTGRVVLAPEGILAAWFCREMVETNARNIWNTGAAYGKVASTF
jgi:hypothetical protein